MIVENDRAFLDSSILRVIDSVGRPVDLRYLVSGYANHPIVCTKEGDFNYRSDGPIERALIHRLGR
jgi:hypothetical protein